MKAIYKALLRLYPRDYRDLFGHETLMVFKEASQEYRDRGWGLYVCFLLVELFGILTGAARQWLAHREQTGADQRASVGFLGEQQWAIDSNLRRMTDAIARRDFLTARSAYHEDLKRRADLRDLRDRFGFDD